MTRLLLMVGFFAALALLSDGALAQDSGDEAAGAPAESSIGAEAGQGLSDIAKVYGNGGIIDDIDKTGGANVETIWENGNLPPDPASPPETAPAPQVANDPPPDAPIDSAPQQAVDPSPPPVEAPQAVEAPPAGIDGGGGGQPSYSE